MSEDQIIQFQEGMELITDPSDPSRFWVLGRDACGPFIGRAEADGIHVDPNDLLRINPGPAGLRALQRLREEQEKDRREGRQYPDRCGPPIS